MAPKYKAQSNKPTKIPPSLASSSLGGHRSHCSNLWRPLGSRPIFWSSLAERGIHPHEALNGSSLRLPFVIKNASIWPIRNAQMICGIDWAVAKDSRYVQMNFMQVAFENAIISIDAGATSNYECDASQLVTVEKDGTWKLRTMAIQGRAVYLTPPLNYRKMCIWMRGTYTLGPIPVTFASPMFEWPSAPGVFQWLEGSTFRQHAVTPDDWMRQRESLPADVVTCAARPSDDPVIFFNDGSVIMGGPLGKKRLPGPK